MGKRKAALIICFHLHTYIHVQTHAQIERNRAGVQSIFHFFLCVKEHKVWEWLSLCTSKTEGLGRGREREREKECTVYVHVVCARARARMLSSQYNALSVYPSHSLSLTHTEAIVKTLDEKPRDISVSLSVSRRWWCWDGALMHRHTLTSNAWTHVHCVKAAVHDTWNGTTVWNLQLVDKLVHATLMKPIG